METLNLPSKENEFAARLIALRKKRSWSQQFVADRLGLSNRTICKWETGRGTPKFMTLLALSSLFEVGLDELAGNKSVQKNRDENLAIRKIMWNFFCRGL